jgi:sialidase-1
VILHTIERLPPATLLFILVAACRGVADGAEHLFEETDLFVSSLDDYTTFRIPALVCTKTGMVLAFSEGRRDVEKNGGPTDIVLKRNLHNVDPWHPAFTESRTEGRTCENTAIGLPLQKVLESINQQAWINPVPVIDQPNGTIFLAVNRYHQPYQDANAPIFLVESRDEGATWSAPVEITQETGKHEIGPGVGIQLLSGRLVTQVYDGILFSDDHGKSRMFASQAPGDWNETQVVELVGGSFLFSRGDSAIAQFCLPEIKAQPGLSLENILTFRTTTAREA